MSESDLEVIWAKQSASLGLNEVDVPNVVEDVLGAYTKLQRSLFWRDFREVVVALILIPVWLFLGVYNQSLWTWYLMVPSVIGVIGFLLVARYRNRMNQPEWGESLLVGLNKATRDLEHQIWLLRNVAFWYLIPIASCLICYDLHECIAAQSSFSSMLWSVVTTLGLFTLIWWLNQRALRKSLKPQLENLQSLLNDSES